MPERPLGFPVAAFIEAHIEQGPELEARGDTIGIVTGIQGARRFLIEIEGEDAHAGTTSRARRKDALSAAVRMVTALEKVFHDDPGDTVRFTVGRFRIRPDAPAVVPGHAMFTIDFRNPEEAVLAKLGDQVEGICRAAAGPCRVTVTETSRSRPVPFTSSVPDLIEEAAAALDYRRMRILSGAGHDAMHLAKVCPTGMIFVPCEKGVSHSESENAAPATLPPAPASSPPASSPWRTRHKPSSVRVQRAATARAPLPPRHAARSAWARSPSGATATSSRSSQAAMRRSSAASASATAPRAIPSSPCAVRTWRTRSARSALRQSRATRRSPRRKGST